MAGKFELYTDKAGEYRFRLKAGNGETIAVSEGYGVARSSSHTDLKRPASRCEPYSIACSQSLTRRSTPFTTKARSAIANALRLTNNPMLAGHACVDLESPRGDLKKNQRLSLQFRYLRNYSGGCGDPGAGGEEFAECFEGVLVLLDGGGEVGPDVQERDGTFVAAPAAGDLLLQFDHPDVAFGLVVVEGDPEVVGESQDVVLVDIKSSQQGSGKTETGSALFPGRWWGRMQAHSLGQQDPISVSVAGQPSCRETGLPAGFGPVDGDVHFDQQVTEPGGPVLASEFGDPGEFTQMMGVMENSP